MVSRLAINQTFQNLTALVILIKSFVKHVWHQGLISTKFNKI